MKHLKKIFESAYEEIDIEILKSFIEDIEDEFGINIFIEDVLFISKKMVISPSYRSDWIEFEESEGEDVYGYGYSVSLKREEDETTNINRFIKANNILSKLLLVGKRINDHLDSKVFVSSQESQFLLIIRKNNPNKDDYYKILMHELDVYKDESDYSDILLEKDDSDYFIVFKSAGSNPVIQKKYLEYFMKDIFTKITYDELIIIDNNSLKLKNPKCDFIKFKI